MRYLFLWSGLLLLLLSGACEPVGEELPFFVVTTEPWSREEVALGRLRLRGNLTGTGGQGVTDHGFYFGSDRAAVVAADPATAQSLGPAGDGTFEQLTDPLTPDIWYYFRAYAQRDSRDMTGLLDSFRLGLAMALTPLGVRRNDTVSFRLEVTGFDGFALPQTGYVLLRRAGSSWIRVGDSTEVGTAMTVDFDVVFPAFNTEYAVAPFVRGSRLYEGPRYLIEVTDGWRRFADFGLPVTLAGASVVVRPDTVYLLGGYRTRGNFNVNHAIYAIPYTAGLPPAEWRWQAVTNEFCGDYLGSAGGVSLWHKGRIYTGLGTDGYQGFTVFDWFALRRSSGACPLDQAGFSYRNAVAFAEAGQWYIGTGSVRASTAAEDDLTAGFRLLDPATGSLSAEPLAPLPLTAGAVTLDALPREGAVTFSLGDHNYVGAGFSPPSYLKDFYRFVAPTETEPARWEFVATLPPEAPGRTEAVAFTIAGRGYVGTGRTRGDVRLADLWMFDPATESWVARQPLPGRPRSGAVGFTLGDYACICGGETLLEETAGQDEVSMLRDCWVYYPEK
jgi:hypothetical protein